MSIRELNPDVTKFFIGKQTIDGKRFKVFACVNSKLTGITKVEAETCRKVMQVFQSLYVTANQNVKDKITSISAIESIDRSGIQTINKEKVTHADAQTMPSWEKIENLIKGVIPVKTVETGKFENLLPQPNKLVPHLPADTSNEPECLQEYAKDKDKVVSEKQVSDPEMDLTEVYLKQITDLASGENLSFPAKSASLDMSDPNAIPVVVLDLSNETSVDALKTEENTAKWDALPLKNKQVVIKDVLSPLFNVYEQMHGLEEALNALERVLKHNDASLVKTFITTINDSIINEYKALVKCPLTPEQLKECDRNISISHQSITFTMPSKKTPITLTFDDFQRLLQRKSLSPIREIFGLMKSTFSQGIYDISESIGLTGSKCKRMETVMDSKDPGVCLKEILENYLCNSLDILARIRLLITHYFSPDLTPSLSAEDKEKLLAAKYILQRFTPRGEAVTLPAEAIGQFVTSRFRMPLGALKNAIGENHSKYKPLAKLEQQLEALAQDFNKKKAEIENKEQAFLIYDYIAEKGKISTAELLTDLRLPKEKRVKLKNLRKCFASLSEKTKERLNTPGERNTKPLLLYPYLAADEKSGGAKSLEEFMKIFTEPTKAPGQA